ncbi:MAG: hypothetical protein RLZZ234_681 [Candidatus Parcubacteria bacterium]
MGGPRLKNSTCVLFFHTWSEPQRCFCLSDSSRQKPRGEKVWGTFARSCERFSAQLRKYPQDNCFCKKGSRKFSVRKIICDDRGGVAHKRHEVRLMCDDTIESRACAQGFLFIIYSTKPPRWLFQSAAYTPPCASSTSWVPSSAIPPFPKTIILSIP